MRNKLGKDCRMFHVPCIEGQVHRIIVSRRGRYFIDRHTPDAEIALYLLSGHRVSTCTLAVCRLKGWHQVQGLTGAVFPPRLRALFMEANNKREKRNHLNTLDYENKLQFIVDRDNWKFRKFKERNQLEMFYDHSRKNPLGSPLSVRAKVE